MGSRNTGVGQDIQYHRAVYPTALGQGFAMVVYDYKFPTLATKLYYHYKKTRSSESCPKAANSI